MFQNFGRNILLAKNGEIVAETCYVMFPQQCRIKTGGGEAAGGKTLRRQFTSIDALNGLLLLSLRNEYILR